VIGYKAGKLQQDVTDDILYNIALIALVLPPRHLASTPPLAPDRPFMIYLARGLERPYKVFHRHGLLHLISVLRDNCQWKNILFPRQIHPFRPPFPSDPVHTHIPVPLHRQRPKPDYPSVMVLE
jgi:hypothetical protein